MVCEFCNDLGYLGSIKEKRFCLDCERGRFLAASEPKPRGDAMGSIIHNLTLGYALQETPVSADPEDE